ncbi:hypothetical protein BSL82_03455 [Tardibacter chloracetimidivorans]|uniref:Uncharacterized protein n=1 Tax=Tardibacter chloracetimidivorans TaxID=1921510 RepID=A0A1L3ZS73_9SPHN|nr:hypothetical protein [Tardibacter chloracetimidivorans]API58474.1 hypothetical protein BSL82_03455 [Tardibacter chloracetimidivorans]
MTDTTKVTYDPDGYAIATIDLSQIKDTKELRDVTEAIIETLVLPSDYAHSVIQIKLKNVVQWTKMSGGRGLNTLNGWIATIQQVAGYSANVLADRLATARPVVTIDIT